MCITYICLEMKLQRFYINRQIWSLFFEEHAEQLPLIHIKQGPIIRLISRTHVFIMQLLKQAFSEKRRGEIVSILFVALGSCVIVLSVYTHEGLSPERKWVSGTPGVGQKLPVFCCWCFSLSMTIFLPFSELRSEGYCVGGSPNTEEVTG